MEVMLHSGRYGVVMLRYPSPNSQFGQLYNNNPLFILGSLFSAMGCFSTGPSPLRGIILHLWWEETGESGRNPQDSVGIRNLYIKLFLEWEHNTPEEMLCSHSGNRTRAPVVAGQSHNHFTTETPHISWPFVNFIMCWWVTKVCHR